MQSRSHRLQSIAIHGPVGGVLHTADGPVDIRGDHVSANFLDVLGVPPLLGRGFLPGEDRAGAAPVLLVTHSFWQRHLGGDSTAVGRVLYLDDVAFTVIGVMPPSFRTQFSDVVKQDYWTNYVQERTRQFELEEGYELIGRLAAGVKLAAARKELLTISASTQVPAWSGSERRLGMVPLKSEVVRDRARALKLMLGAVAIVLLVVCSNLALLLLARSDNRVSEFATRKAIGAATRQLFRLALTESLLLALAGGAAGVALAYSVLPLMLALAPGEIPRISESAVNVRALAVALACTLLTGCAFGLAPALRLARTSLVQAMKRAPGRATQSDWFRSVLVGGQVAASLALCILAGLVGRTFLTLLPSDPGFEPRGLSYFAMYLPTKIYPTAAERSRLQGELLRSVRSQPGINAVAFAENIPFSGDALSVAVRDTRAPAADTTRLPADVRAVSANYHELLHIALRRGRTFTLQDEQGSSAVAIVNETLARRLDSSGNVIGRTVRIGRTENAREYEIVGVVANTRTNGTDLEILNEVHVPYVQRGSSFGFLVLRSSLNQGQLTRVLRSEIRGAAPALPMMENRSAQTMADLMRQSLAGPRFSATLATTFSVIAMLLAAMGVFGLVAYAIAQRRQEFGIRSALGARPRDLAITAMRSALLLTAMGVTLGLALAAFLTRFIESQLYAVRPLDAPTFLGAAAATLIVAGMAAAIPARQAVRIDPMTALR